MNESGHAMWPKVVNGHRSRKTISQGEKGRD